MAAALVIAAVLVLSGCVDPARPLPPPMSLEQVVDAVNSNNEKLPYFKAAISSVRGDIVADSGKVQNLDVLGLFGWLIYAQPMHLRMDLSKATTSVMGLGSNESVYWMWGAAPYIGKCWVGSFPRADKGAIPIDPQQVAQLLGVDEIRPLDLPMLRVSEPGDRANILTCVRYETPCGRMMCDMPPRLSLAREIWVDRDSNLPKRVRLFNADGQAIIESTLRDWKKTKGGEAMFPHDVEIRSIVFKQTKKGQTPAPGSRLRLGFAAVDVNDKFDPAKRPQVYQFRGVPADVIRIPLDEFAASQADAPAGERP